MNIEQTLTFYRATHRIIPAPAVIVTRIVSGAFKRTLKRPVEVTYITRISRPTH